MATPRAPHEHGRIRRPSPLSECGSAVTLTLESLAIVNGRDISVATVTVVAETETVRHDETLAPNAQSVLKLPQMKGCTATVQAVFEGGEVSVIVTIDVCRVKLGRLIE